MLSFRVGPKAEDQLKQEGKTRIEEAERTVRQIARKPLAADQHETLLTIQSFLSKAKEAFFSGDFPKALNLGNKAKILADELLRVLQ